METQIVPCRAEISDRFPVASFAVNVPPSRHFEVACATDPRLFHSDWQRYRSPQNFYSSRSDGLMHAPQGHTAWFIPPEQLRRFVGAPRIYYALATYENRYGGAPEFTISPDTLDRVPSIAVSPDFTGRGLDRARLGMAAPVADSYGSVDPAPLSWGGDDALAAYRAASVPQTGSYDDGYPADLWEGEPVAEQAAYAEELGECRDTDDFSAGLDADGYSDSYEKAPAAEAHASQDAVSVHGDSDGSEWEAYGSVHDDEADEDDEGVYGAPQPPAEPVYGAAYAPAGEEGGVALAEAPVEALAGRDPLYSDEEPEEEPLPVGRASHALAVVALDIPEKVRLLRVLAQAESGRDGYSAINPDNEYNDPRHPAYHRYHIGLSWGFVQFTQRSGALGRVLQAVQRREQALGAALPAEHRFERLFAPHADELIRVTTAGDPEARVAPVGGKPLWDREWTERFRAAGQVPHVTYAQNEVAITDYVDSTLRLAAWMGFDTPRALAMLWDRCIHMGVGGGTAWVMRACGPIRTEGERTAALAALGHADLRAFQRSQAPHLAADGRWGPRTHAAMVAALRAIGSRSPVAIPTRDAMLQQMVAEARGTGFERRLTALHANRTELDDSTSYLLG